MSEQVKPTKLIQCFEDLKVWQEARQLAKMVYEKTREGNTDTDLKRQMRRASVSTMANIAEGFGRFTTRDRKQFLIMARGSLAELQSHLYVAQDQSYLADTDCAKIKGQTILVSKLLNGLIGYLTDNLSRLSE